MKTINSIIAVVLLFCFCSNACVPANKWRITIVDDGVIDDSSWIPGFSFTREHWAEMEVQLETTPGTWQAVVQTSGWSVNSDIVPLTYYQGVNFTASTPGSKITCTFKNLLTWGITLTDTKFKGKITMWNTTKTSVYTIKGGFKTD